MREEDSYLPAVAHRRRRARGRASARWSRAGERATAPGDLVMGLPGWQDYWTVTSEDAAQVVPPGIPVEDMLSIYGGTGVDRVLRPDRDRQAAAGGDRRGLRRGRRRRIGRGPDREDQGRGARRRASRAPTRSAVGSSRTSASTRASTTRPKTSRRDCARRAPTASTCTSTTSAARSSTPC